MVYVGTNQGRGQVQLQEAGEDDKPKGKMKCVAGAVVEVGEHSSSIQSSIGRP